MTVKCKLRKVSGTLQDTNKFYAEAIRYSRIDADAFVDYMATNSQLGRPGIMGTLAGVAETMLYFLQTGHSVEVPELGTFSINVKASAEQDEDGKWQLKDAQVRRLQFTPNPRLRDLLKATKFELADESLRKVPLYSRESSLDVIKKLCQRDGNVTLQTYRHETGCSDYRARKTFKRLVNEGHLTETQSGRITVYSLAE
ncbi:MAG: hypothetical protein IJT90_00565 [Bacteroidaceae bacterium]|nr:hypothetical protein [Bacteroidaceae bacterium]